MLFDEFPLVVNPDPTALDLTAVEIPSTKFDDDEEFIFSYTRNSGMTVGHWSLPGEAGAL